MEPNENYCHLNIETVEIAHCHALIELFHMDITVTQFSDLWYVLAKSPSFPCVMLLNRQTWIHVRDRCITGRPNLILKPHNSICINALGYTDIFLLLSAQFVTSTRSTPSVYPPAFCLHLSLCLCVLCCLCSIFRWRVCLCVLRMSDVTQGQQLNLPSYLSRYLFAGLSVVSPTSVWLLSDKCVFERVCVRVICQCLPPESDILQRISARHTHTNTHIYWIKMYTHTLSRTELPSPIL